MTLSQLLSKNLHFLFCVNSGSQTPKVWWRLKTFSSQCFAPTSHKQHPRVFHQQHLSALSSCVFIFFFCTAFWCFLQFYFAKKRTGRHLQAEVPVRAPHLRLLRWAPAPNPPSRSAGKPFSGKGPLLACPSISNQAVNPPGFILNGWLLSAHWHSFIIRNGFIIQDQPADFREIKNYKSACEKR